MARDRYQPCLNLSTLWQFVCHCQGNVYRTSIFSELKYAEEDFLLSTFSKRPQTFKKTYRLKEPRQSSISAPSMYREGTQAREVQFLPKDHRGGGQHRAESSTRGSQLQTGDVPPSATLQPQLCHKPASRLRRSLRTPKAGKTSTDHIFGESFLPSHPKRQSYTNLLSRAKRYLRSTTPTIVYT